MCSRGALSPDHDWKGKQNLSLKNHMMCLGQPAVQYMEGMDGRIVKLTDFFFLFLLSVRDGKELGQSFSLSAVIRAYISLLFHPSLLSFKITNRPSSFKVVLKQVQCPCFCHSVCNCHV